MIKINRGNAARVKQRATFPIKKTISINRAHSRKEKGGHFSQRQEASLSFFKRFKSYLFG